MHHGKSRGSQKTKKNENKGVINFAEKGEYALCNIGLGEMDAPNQSITWQLHQSFIYSTLCKAERCFNIAASLEL